MDSSDNIGEQVAERSPDLQASPAVTVDNPSPDGRCVASTKREQRCGQPVWGKSDRFCWRHDERNVEAVHEQAKRASVHAALKHRQKALKDLASPDNIESPNDILKLIAGMVRAVLDGELDCDRARTISTLLTTAFKGLELQKGPATTAKLIVELEAGGGKTAKVEVTGPIEDVKKIAESVPSPIETPE